MQKKQKTSTVTALKSPKGREAPNIESVDANESTQRNTYPEPDWAAAVKGGDARTP